MWAEAEVIYEGCRQAARPVLSKWVWRPGKGKEIEVEIQVRSSVAGGDGERDVAGEREGGKGRKN